jgi:hypothetical protein
MRMNVSRTKILILIICIYVLSVCGVFLSNSIRTTGALNVVTAQLRFIFPQHWGFFTKGNSVYTRLYFIEHDQLRYVNANRGSAFNSYGFGKQSRILKSVIKNFRKNKILPVVNNAAELRDYLNNSTPVPCSDLSVFDQFKGKKVALLVQPIQLNPTDTFQYPLKIQSIYVPN